MSNRAQKRAQKENFAIWVLRGFQSKLYFIKPVVTSDTYWAIHHAIRVCLSEIKYAQQDRNPSRRIKPL